MNILTFDTEEQLNEAGAGVLSGMVQMNPSAILGLATGGTPIGIYEQLVQTYKRGLVSFNKVTTFNLDEYVGITPEHHQSYSYYMRQHLFNQVDINIEQAYVPCGTATDLEEECVRYDRLIENTGQIDIQLLGLGHNGHIGFNEPSHALLSGTHIVELAEATKTANARYFSAEEEVPQKAITMGVGMILKAKNILLVVKGEDKAEIVKRALTGPISTNCPASLLQTHPHLTVLLDRAAGSLL
ncbi:glucosamine-6-phosphate deaminase [Paenibacillus endoradicis]|uniref:glucosamine-6-phosphate deaminase n=1 Tax=Paenibacillus endoradicis TaxID=2972487 RepID=UPI002158EA2C|nr:glucosamine-6-phosphate deaminase [Paenibacillus endoradicis]MCR8657202.1 glucosamine-6-phosphate deaminase [Paenibacillus endoradicis]